MMKYFLLYDDDTHHEYINRLILKMFKKNIDIKFFFLLFSFHYISVYLLYVKN